MIYSVRFKKVMVIVVCVFASMLTFGETQVVNGITWTYVVSGGKASVGGGGSGLSFWVAVSNSTEGVIAIPSTLGGCPVASIAEGAFFACKKVTSVKIPSSVTSIGEEAFMYCHGLTSLAIPSSVKSIGADAFCDCNGLTTVTIPSSVTSIGARAFSQCSGLTSLVLSEGLGWIGESMFDGCFGLTSVNIPSSVTSIGKKAFRHCQGLTSVYIPSSLTSIGEEVFYGCSGLTSLTIPSSVTSIGKGAFRYCNGLKSLTIPSSVTSIGDYAFDNCHGLTSVNIPSSLKSISFSAFRSCIGLVSLTIPEGVTSIGHYAFDSCYGLTSVTIPSSVTSIGVDAFSWCVGLTAVTIPSNVTSIGAAAFYKCSGLTSVTISEGVKIVGERVFHDCAGLKSLTIPSSVESIGSNAFKEMGDDAEFVFEGAPPYTPYPLAGAEVDGYRGYYRNEYADEWLSVLDENGKWKGIAMKELEVPDPSLTIKASEMDWGSGEITLRYQRADGKSLSADGRTFEVYWSDVTNGVDQTRRVSHFPNSGIVRDSDFLMRGDGIHPVYYTVVASDGTKACCKTRDRYGVFVGVTDYGDSYLDRTPSPEMGKDADFVASMFRANAGLADSNMWVLKGAKATRGDISDCMKLISERAGVGDAVMVYFSCHGGYDENDTDYALCLYDGYYPSTDFSEDIKKVDGNGDSGIGIVCVMDACYSQSAYDREKISGEEMDWYVKKALTVCSKNVSYVAASLTDETAEYKFGLTKFMIGYGWREGYAKGRSTIGEYRFDLMKLSQYAKQHIELIGRQHVDYVNENLLRNFVIHIPANSPVTERPSEPIGLRASQGSSDKGIYVSFSPSEDADFYVVYNQKDGKRHVVATTTNTWCVPRDADGKILQSGRFFVAAVNGFGVSALGGPVSGWVRSCDEKPVETVFPDIEGDPVATVTGDVEMGFVVKPSEGNTAVEVTIPQGVDAAQVTVEVSTKVASVKPNGAKVKIVSGSADITEYLDIPGTAKGDDGGVVATQETIDLTKATVKEEIVKEAMDVEKGAVIDLSGGSLGTTSPTITTAPTHVGLFYTFSEGRTLGGMERSDSKVGDGQPWSPEIKVKGGSSAFYSIGVDKGE